MIITIKKRNIMSRTRFVVSIVTLAFITSVLVVGSVGSLLQQANARSNRDQYNSGQNHNDRNQSNNQSNGSRNNDNNKQATTNKSNNNTNNTSTERQATPPTPPPTPQITQAPAIVREAPPVDTAADVAAMTAAQATTTGQTVAYASKRISDETRNRLIMLAGVATVAGGLLYTMSYVGAFSRSSRPIPVRYIVPVREVATS